MPYNSTYLGTVQDVQGATVNVKLDKDTISGLVFIDGHGYRIGQIGSFIRIPIGFVDLFGIVSQVGAGAVPETLAHTEPYGYRWLKVQLIGEGQRSGPFQRGVSQYPTINDEAHLVTEQDLTKIYGKPDEPGHVRIGGVASAESIPALVDVNRLVTRHCAVLGTTGAGKSTTVANLLASFSDQDRYPSARIIVLDIHGEYHTALKDRATIFRINADTSRDEEPLFVPYWALSFDELLSVTPFGGVSDTDRVALVDRLKRLKSDSLRAKSRSGVTPDTVTVDTPIPFSIHRFWYELYRDVLSHHTAQGVNQTRDTEAIACDAEGEKLIGDIMTVQPPEYLPITAGGPDRVYLMRELSQHSEATGCCRVPFERHEIRFSVSSGSVVSRAESPRPQRSTYKRLRRALGVVVGWEQADHHTRSVRGSRAYPDGSDWSTSQVVIRCTVFGAATFLKVEDAGHYL